MLCSVLSKLRLGKSVVYECVLELVEPWFGPNDHNSVNAYLQFRLIEIKVSFTLLVVKV